MVKTRWIAVLVTCFILSGLALAGCGGQKPPAAPAAGGEDKKFGGRLIAARATTTPHLDSDKSTAQEINEIMSHIYEGLIEFDKTFKPTPNLAESFEIADQGRTYKFKLRKGVLFHNGKEMTSADVEASFQRWLENNGAGKIVKPYLESVTVGGPLEISFTFKKPYAPFLSLLASNSANQKFVIRPKELVEKYKTDVLKEHIGTGPFQFVEWIPDKYVKVKKFDKYVAGSGEPSAFAGKKTAYVNEIEFRYVPERAVRMAGVQTREYHWAEDAPLDQYDMFKANAGLQPFIVSPFNQAFMIINFGQAPFNNLKARQALVAALDVKELAMAMVGNEKFWHLNGAYFAPGNIWHDPDAGKGVYNATDLNKAKELLKQAGYDGKPIVILNERENMVHSQAAVALKSQLEKAGFKVEVRLLDRASVVEQRAKKDTWNIHLSSFRAPDPDPQVYGAWMGTNKWIGSWDDEYSRRMDAIYDRMQGETDQKKRYEIIKEWYKEIWTSLPYVKLVDYDRLVVAHKSLQGYANFTAPFFWNVWLEEK